MDFKKNWVSNRFKTEADREWHTETQLEIHAEVDNDTCAAITKATGLACKVLTMCVVRVTDGKKRLDLYKRRYHKVDTNERGDLEGCEHTHKLLVEYFGLPEPLRYNWL